MCTPMHDPVVAGDGFTYERSAIAKWLEEHNTSPLTNERLQTDRLVPNKTLKIAIKDFPKRQHERLTNAVRAAREGGKTKEPAPSLATLAKVAKFSKRLSSKKLLDAPPPPLTREKSSNGPASVAAAIFAGMDTDGDGVVTREELEAYLAKTGGAIADRREGLGPAAACLCAQVFRLHLTCSPLRAGGGPSTDSERAEC